MAIGDGKRYNEGKLRMDLVPTSSIRSLARVLTYGAGKYAERNWESGMNFSIPYACLLRHLTAWYDGEDLDKESGLNHLDHVMANVAMLIHYVEKCYTELDNRPK